MSEFFGSGVVASIKFLDEGNYKQKEEKGRLQTEKNKLQYKINQK